MPTKSVTSISKKRRKSARVRRKRAKFPSATIVALNLSKCVSRNLTDLIAKLEISKKHQKEKALQNQEQGTAQSPVSQEKEKARKKIPKITRKKFISLGKIFIKDFKHFSKSNERCSSGNRISYPQTLSWLKKAELLDNHRITIRDVEVHYINQLKTGYELKVLEFIRFLKSLCEDRGLEMTTVIFKLLKCRKRTKSIKKKKMTRYSKKFKRKQETPRASKKKASTIHTLVKQSKEKVLDNVEEFEVISGATCTVFAKTEDSSVLSASVRETDISGEKTNKITYDDQNLLCDSVNILCLNKNKGWTDCDVNSDPLLYLPEFSEDDSEENFTDPMKDKTTAQNEYLGSINDCDLENIVSTHAFSTFYSGKHSMFKKEAAEWVIPALKSVPPQISANEVNDNDSKKLEMKCTPNRFQNSASESYRFPNVRKVKLETKSNRNNVPVATKLGVVKTVNKKGQPKYALTKDTGKISEAQNEEESYEYIDSDESDDSTKYKVHSLNTHCSFLEFSEYKINKTNKSETINDIKKVDIKTGEHTKSRNKSLNKEPSEPVSIQHFDMKKNAEDGGKRNKCSFEIFHKINEKKRSKFHIPSEDSSSSKIRSYMRRIFNGDLSGKMEEKIQEFETENKELSPNRKITPTTPRLQSELQESNSSPDKRALGERDMKDQKSLSLNIKKTEKTQTEKSPLNACLTIQSPERKRNPIKNNRTFTNLPVKQVRKSLQKLRKEKILKMQNNENAAPISKFIGPTNGRKITSSKERATVSTKCDTVKSKLIDGTRKDTGSEKEKILKMQNNENAVTISKFIEPTNGRKITSSKERATVSTKCDTVKSKLIDGTSKDMGSETQNSNTDVDFTADILKSEADKHEMKQKKTAKRHKIRKGVHLRKKEFKDPVTEIQDQKLSKT